METVSRYHVFKAMEINEMIQGKYSRERREPQPEKEMRRLSCHRFQDKRRIKRESSILSNLAGMRLEKGLMTVANGNSFVT